MINEELEVHLNNIIQNMKEMTDILKRLIQDFIKLLKMVS